MAGLQEEKGLQKYGQSLDPLDIRHDWLVMAEEELVDGYKYLNAERVRRTWIRDHILSHISRAQSILYALETNVIETVETAIEPISAAEVNLIHTQFKKAQEELREILLTVKNI